MAADKDTEMKDASKSTEDTKTTTVTKKTVDPSTALINEIRACLKQINHGVALKDTRPLIKVLRGFGRFRHRLTADVLAQIVQETLPESLAARDSLCQLLAKVPAEEPKDEDMADASSSSSGDDKNQDDSEGDKKDEGESQEEEVKVVPAAVVLPEIEMYVRLVVTVFLVDKGLKEASLSSVDELISRLSGYNRRTMDQLSARAWFYFSLCHQRLDRLTAIRARLIAAHRTSCLRHDEPSQAVLTNLILHNFIQLKQYEQADQFRLNTRFPVSSGFQYARFLYYTGRINAIQLKYTEANNSLQQSIRKAPQQGAIGFRETAHKWMLITQLLLGDIPERNIFSQPDLRRSLKPYFQLTQSVRVGDLAGFVACQEAHSEVFKRDQLYTLVVRLRHNVIKTGLRKINLSYSKISLADVCRKLCLDNVVNTEYVVAKAISDRVIDAVIDQKNGFLFSRENTDVYSTNEPSDAFHKRVDFCIGIHNEAVKALHYPDEYQKSSEDAVVDEMVREEAEIAKEIQDHQDEEDF